ncbi:hypothetical protein F5877DRAFT_36132 [Lentinula edodes]|nr:hypothetical protein F5877DRAFT_36132 [Lentinula edodes]
MRFIRTLTTASGRLPRFTLYSGPACSLCDTAKEELDKVRQDRKFHLDVVNIQDPGQEKWKRKYVYWIPALHLEGKEIAKGRWDAQIVREALNLWDQENVPGEHNGSDYSEFFSALPSEHLFFTDTSLAYEDNSSNSGIYARNIHDILGANPETENEIRSVTPHCFNCGSSSHMVNACPEQVDRALVSLSRQMNEFYRDMFSLDRIGGDFSARIYSVEEWKSVRLDWINSFNPGEIKGHDLRQALGIIPAEDDSQAQDEWLQNMAVWGYPPGWISRWDPKELMKERVLSQCIGNPQESEQSFHIFGEEGNSETVLDQLKDPSKLLNSSVDQTLKRWAFYPPLQFSSSLLPVYNGVALPPVEPKSQVSYYVPFFAVLPAPPPPPGSPPPLPPPPPIEPPPPLPPSLPPSTPPSLPSTAFLSALLPLRPKTEAEDSDMDMSDEE